MVFRLSSAVEPVRVLKLVKNFLFCGTQTVVSVFLQAPNTKFSLLLVEPNAHPNTPLF